MCDAKIRPLPSDLEIQCGRDGNDHNNHRGSLEDYAYPGSETIIYWLEEDRRNFRGEWKDCLNPLRGTCVLPSGHRGNHAF